MLDQLAHAVDAALVLGEVAGGEGFLSCLVLLVGALQEGLDGLVAAGGGGRGWLLSPAVAG